MLEFDRTTVRLPAQQRENRSFARQTWSAVVTTSIVFHPYFAASFDAMRASPWVVLGSGLKHRIADAPGGCGGHWIPPGIEITTTEPGNFASITSAVARRALYSWPPSTTTASAGPAPSDAGTT